MTFEERFWDKVRKGDGCWLWLGAKTSGYGVINREGRMVRAHRVAWEIARGTIPEGLWVLHHCDNPACVRAEHLFVGTCSDNMKDAASKHRLGFQLYPELHRGSGHGMAKLTPADVSNMRETRGITYAELGRRFGISSVQARNIVTRKQWAHI